MSSEARQHCQRHRNSGREPADDEMNNLRRFLAVLQRWDREARAQEQDTRAQALVGRCFTDDADSCNT